MNKDNKNKMSIIELKRFLSMIRDCLDNPYMRKYIMDTYKKCKVYEERAFDNSTHYIELKPVSSDSKSPLISNAEDALKRRPNSDKDVIAKKYVRLNHNDQNNKVSKFR